MTQDQVTGLLRAVLTMIGGVFVSKGVVSGETVSWLVGGVLTFVGAGWSLWSNRPAALASSAQALTGVNVQTSSTAPKSVVEAVAAAKDK
jgi:hypothetical protein